MLTNTNVNVKYVEKKKELIKIKENLKKNKFDFKNLIE